MCQASTYLEPFALALVLSQRALPAGILLGVLISFKSLFNFFLQSVPLHPAQTVSPAHHCVFFSRVLIVIWDTLILLTHCLTHIHERSSSVKARTGVVLFHLPSLSFSAISSLPGTCSHTGKAFRKYSLNERMNEIKLL